jgi:hypothetical protein
MVLAAVGLGLVARVIAGLFLGNTGAPLWLAFGLGLPLAVFGLGLAASQRRWLGTVVVILGICGVALLVLIFVALIAGVFHGG